MTEWTSSEKALSRIAPAMATPKWPVRARRGFSLLELVVVLAVTVLLTSILMPALSGLREHTERVMSASNMRQIGMGLTMYATDSAGRLPYSTLIHADQPGLMQEMMATYIAESDTDLRDRLAPPADAPNASGAYRASNRSSPLLMYTSSWEGLGLLYSGAYLNAPDVFYCPSHTGDHPVERYRDQYLQPTGTIYCNYHYRGDIDLDDNNRPLTLERDAYRVLVTDGMRTRRDLNHRLGFNSLLGDGSVIWRVDTEGELYGLLPDGPVTGDVGQLIYQLAWEIVEGREDEESD